MDTPTTQNLERFVQQHGLDQRNNTDDGNYLLHWGITLRRALHGTLRNAKRKGNDRNINLRSFAAYALAHQESVHPSRKTVTRRAESSEDNEPKKSPEHEREKSLICTVLGETELWLPDALTPAALQSGYREAFHDLMVVGFRASVAEREEDIPTFSIDEAITDLVKAHAISINRDPEAMDSLARIAIMKSDARQAALELVQMFIEK